MRLPLPILLLCATAAQAAKWISEISGDTLLCPCAVMDTCKSEANSKVTECMTECEDHLENYGSRTSEYRSCFDTETIKEAERCLYQGLSDMCTWRYNEEKYIEAPKWDELNTVKYDDERVVYRSEGVWRTHEPKYNYMQNYLHCTKNCMHGKLKTCTDAKNCTLRMPSTSVFREKMFDCLKRNDKIAKSLLATCQCLAWKKGVTSLQGSCVVIGNRYYIDRA